MKFKAEQLVGRVEGIYKSINKDHFVTEPLNELRFELEGIEGDRHFGHVRYSSGREKKYYSNQTLTRNNRQWSGVSTEEIEIIKSEMQLPEVLPEWLGANLLVSGIPNFSKLPPLSHLMIGDDKTCLVVFEENGPCIYPDKVINENVEIKSKKSFPKAARGLRGVVGWIDKAGLIKVGDKIVVLIPEH